MRFQYLVPRPVALVPRLPWQHLHTYTSMDKYYSVFIFRVPTIYPTHFKSTFLLEHFEKYSLWWRLYTGSSSSYRGLRFKSHAQFISISHLSCPTVLLLQTTSFWATLLLWPSPFYRWLLKKRACSKVGFSRTTWRLAISFWALEPAAWGPEEHRSEIFVW